MAKPLPTLDSSSFLNLSITNTYRKKPVSQLTDQPLKDLAFKVDTDIRQHQHDLGELSKTMDELKLETTGLQQQFLGTLDKIKQQN
jgi:hypothetical protein